MDYQFDQAKLASARSSVYSESNSSIRKGGYDRGRSSALTRILASGEMSNVPARPLTTMEKVETWFVNEGSRRVFVVVWLVLQAALFSFAFVNYQFKDNLNTARATFGPTYQVARAAAVPLNFNVAVILLPVSRTLISLLRRTHLNGIVQFDKNITFHKLVAWCIVFFTVVHVVAHENNFAQLSAKNHLGFVGFLLANFKTIPGWSGWIMNVVLGAMVATSLEKPRRKNFERFWYTHHLFILFFIFWSVHGEACMIPADFAPFCFGNGAFYMYWGWSGIIYLLERLAREVRGKHKTYISKVVQHPSNVIEIQIKKERTKTRAGQYIFLCVPEISVWQYHPFTLTSAPEEDYISVHIRVVGNFTKALAKTLGCDFEKKGDHGNGSEVVGVNPGEAKDVNPSIARLLPRVYVDGPFGSASEDVFKYEVAVLVGAGIGVTPFASILKSIWYRLNYPNPKEKTRLRKIYFFWICRDFGSFEWFRSLLMAIEQQDLDNRIEIHTYLTAKIKSDDATNIMLNDANADVDAITGLRAATSFGRPNWDAIFRGIRKIHTPAEAGVFFCGPKPLGSTLHIKCNMYSDPDFKFVWGKENF